MLLLVFILLKKSSSKWSLALPYSPLYDLIPKPLKIFWLVFEEKKNKRITSTLATFGLLMCV